MSPSPRRTRRLPHLVRTAGACALVAVLATGSAGCSGSAGDGDSESAAPASASQERAADGAAAAADRTAAGGEEGAPSPAVISTGVVSLRTEDVDDAVFEVQRLVDEYDGTLADSQTRSDKEGRARTARLVLRIPSADFDAAMGELAGLATWSESSRTSEDVTTQVIDNEVRLRAQRASLERVEALLARAGSIRDIMAIEAQLTRRQAELDSLAGQQAWLRDQTSQATVKVHIERAPGATATPDEDDDGFLAGLAAGWHGLTRVTVVAATVLGAVLPFAGVALLLGVPLWLAVARVRRVRAGTTARTASAE